MAVPVFFDARDIVGESLVYDDERDDLVWVDIAGKRIHRLNVATRAHDAWPAPDFPTSIGLRKGGGAVVGLRDRVVLWDFGGPFRTLAIVEPDLVRNRLNEGRVAPDGTFWVGTMRDNLNPDGTQRDLDCSSGAVYRVAADGAVTRLTPNEFGITNTMAWTKDGRFLVGDTLKNEIYAYHLKNGGLSDKRLHVAPFARGLPDGSCLDSDDGLWNCRVVGGRAVARFRPDGSFDRLAELPCSWPTSCTFGGADMSTLYVASARFTMSAEHLAANPQEGALFALDVGARGRKENRFGEGAG